MTEAPIFLTPVDVVTGPGNLWEVDPGSLGKPRDLLVALCLWPYIGQYDNVQKLIIAFAVDPRLAMTWTTVKPPNMDGANQMTTAIAGEPFNELLGKAMFSCRFPFKPFR